MPASARPVVDGWFARLGRRLHSRRVQVFEHSMEPALQPGDRLYVDTRAYAQRPPGRGELVVVVDPERAGRYLVKRVGAIAGEIPPGGGAPVPTAQLWLEGDWGTVSRDSRRFGTVPLASVVGQAWWRYFPPERQGPLDGTVR